MIEQKKLIEAVKARAIADENVSALMMYGSFTQGCGDEYSDVEFYVFVKDEAMDGFSGAEWIAGVHPYFTHFFNEFGTEVVIFKNLVRGEFHFMLDSAMEVIESFKGQAYFPDVKAMNLYDSSGRLAAYLKKLDGVVPEYNDAQTIDFLIDNAFNNIIMGLNVLARGEIARSFELLWFVQRYLLQLFRIKEDSTLHWLNMYKNLENEISQGSYHSFIDCTARPQKKELLAAYGNAIDNIENLWRELNKTYGLKNYAELFKAAGAVIKGLDVSGA